jgi:hypothetical protein
MSSDLFHPSLSARWLTLKLMLDSVGVVLKDPTAPTGNFPPVATAITRSPRGSEALPIDKPLNFNDI